MSFRDGIQLVRKKVEKVAPFFGEGALIRSVRTREGE